MSRAQKFLRGLLVLGLCLWLLVTCALGFLLWRFVGFLHGHAEFVDGHWIIYIPF